MVVVVQLLLLVLVCVPVDQVEDQPLEPVSRLVVELDDGLQHQGFGLPQRFPQLNLVDFPDL